MTAPAAIDVRGLWRRFDGRDAIRDLNLVVAAGELHGLVGPNGAGKSTLLRVLAGLVSPTSGTVVVAGAPPTASRSDLGFVPAGGRSFYLRLTGVQNLVFFGRLHGLSRSAAYRRAHELLEHVGLSEAARRKVGHYSSGMQRRLGIARALLSAPAILLVDEATHDLDPHGAEAVRRLVGAAAAKGTAVVWATHRLEELPGFVDRLTILDAGDQIFTGLTSELEPESDAARRFVIDVRPPSAGLTRIESAVRVAMGRAADIAAVASEPDRYVVSLDGSVSLADLINGLSRYHFDVLACREERSTLERVLLEMATRKVA